MPFVESSRSLKSKLNLSNVSTPVLVGIVALAIVAAVLAVQNGLALFDSGGFAIEKGEGAQVDASGEGSADAGGETSGGEGAAGTPGTDGASGQSATSEQVVVFVSGAVAAPGVYSLAQGSRVQDAVKAAGGFSEGAATDSMNLARVLQDGEQVDVITQEEADAGTVPAGSQGAGTTSAGKGQAAALVDINAADASQLETLPGIGPSTAQKIVADRESNGPFPTKEDLMRVSGIGEKKYDSLKDLICVG